MGMRRPGLAGHPVRGAWQPQKQKNEQRLERARRSTANHARLERSAKNRKVKWFVDNKAVVSILRAGRRKPALHSLALEVAPAWGRSSTWSWRPSGSPVEFNQLADEYSRCSDRDEWGMQDAHFIAPP